MEKEFIYNSAIEFNKLYFQELLSYSKLRNTWIAQVVTISSSILGAFAIFLTDKSLTTYIGVLMLLLTVAFGLFLTVRNLNKDIAKIVEAFRADNEFKHKYLTVLHFDDLEYKQGELSQKQMREKEIARTELDNYIKKNGLIDNKGKLNLENAVFKQEISVANWFLIIGLFLGGLLVIVPMSVLIEFIECFKEII